MPFDEHLNLGYYKTLEPYLKRAKEVSLYGLGEPMIDRKYFEKVRYVTSFGADVSLSSNGTLMDEKRCREVIASGIKSIGISLDAATSKTFAIVRPPGGFEKIVENIKRLSLMKQEMGVARPKLMLSFGVMKQNIDDLKLFPNLVKEVGGQEVIVHPVIYMSADKKEELFIESDRVKQAVEAARARSIELGLPFSYWDLDTMTYLKSLDFIRSGLNGQLKHPAPQNGSQSYFCFFLWRNSMIQGRGQLFPCCYMTNVQVGRINQGGMQELRAHPILVDLRRKLYEGSPPEPCASCPQLHPYNRTTIVRAARQEIANFLRS